jgi:4-amino-4-deoxy-L-arabinose transferase-like glycosyltransferase
VNVCYVASFYFLVRHCFDKNVAILSVFGLLTIPVFVQYGRLAWTPNAALCAVCAALYCFVRGTEKNLSWRWILAGSIAVAIGVFFSWEAAPLGFVLLVLATSQQSKIRQIAAATYSVAGIGAVAIVLVLLVSASNDIRNELWATVRFRMGGVYQPTAIPIHALADHVLYTKQHTNLLSWILNILDNWLPRLGGTVGLSSTIGVSLWAWRRRKARPDVLFVVVGLLGIVVVWAVLFPNHITHEYEPLIAAPLFGIAIGVVLKIGGERLKGTGRLVVSIIVPLILIIPLARQAMIAFRRPQPDKIIKYAKDIEGSTPPSAVILSPVDTMVTVYYSRRHIIRSVTDDETLRLVMQQAGSVFPNTDIYIAIPPDSLGWFPCAASRFPLVRHTGNVILLRVTADTCESRSVAEK